MAANNTVPIEWSFPEGMSLVSGTVFVESETLVFERDEMDPFSTPQSTDSYGDAL